MLSPRMLQDSAVRPSGQTLRSPCARPSRSWLHSVVLGIGRLQPASADEPTHRALGLPATAFCTPLFIAAIVLRLRAGRQLARLQQRRDALAGDRG